MERSDTTIDECLARAARHGRPLALVRVGAAPPQGEAAILDGDGRLHLLGARTFLGRDPDSVDLAVTDGSVSRRHALITRDGAGYAISDLGSTNGTYVDGHRVRTLTPLGDRQVVVLGDIAVTFVTEGLVRVCLRATPDDGGGLVELRGARAPVPGPAFRVLRRLAERVLADERSEPEFRGWVRSPELAAVLQLPAAASVRPLVSQVQRLLAGLGAPEALEAHERFGFRLRARPIIVDA
jgi:hypothetical protein